MDKPYISFILHSMKEHTLKQSLEAIFTQAELIDFEVIICDDASDDGGWDLARRIAKQNQGVVTLCRNHHPMGYEKNRQKALMIAKAPFFVELTSEFPFVLSLIKHDIHQLESGETLKHNHIGRLKNISYLPTEFSPITSPVHGAESPLVSICIYNYNYGRYLRECIDSVLAQTYENIEICFSDNASTDDSWDIINHYADNYPQTFNLTRSRENFGAYHNLWSSFLNVQGQFVLKLCSDDVIKPGYIEACVKALMSEPEAAFAMVHRATINEEGIYQQEAPFYDSSCFISGDEQAAVYMMSSVNPSVSQVFYRTEVLSDKRLPAALNERWFGDRLMDFHICCSYPIVYIKEPFLVQRIHQQSDSQRIEENLLQCLGEYVLVHQLADIASIYPGMEKAQARLPAALNKLGKLSLRYCLKQLLMGNITLANRYYHLALAIDTSLNDDDMVIQISRYWLLKTEAEREEHLNIIRSLYSDNIKRNYSYPPPQGARPISR